MADPQSDGQLCATRHYILRQLEVIDVASRRGGRQYSDVSRVFERLSSVRYLNDSFYDPIRAEHRRVSFGFFSYSMPCDLNSSRAWRIEWDPVFFEFVKSAGGSLRFDLSIYRELDPASRRLFLFLTKLFSRTDTTHPLDLQALAVDVLGFSPTLVPRDRKAKVNRCIRKLVKHGVVQAEADTFRKTGVGRYRVVLLKGPSYARPRRAIGQIESPLVEPLAAIGFDAPSINRILKQFPHKMAREWVDITQAARERYGLSFFKRSMAAYFMDNIKAAAAGNRTPPDWWLDIRKAEERSRAERARRRRRITQGPEQLPEKAMDMLDGLHDTVFHQFLAAGQSTSMARINAEKFRKSRRDSTRDP